MTGDGETDEFLAPSYLVCSVQRNGSSVFCESLTSTGQHGRPSEYLLEKDLPRWAQTLGVAVPTDGASTKAFLDAIARSTATPGGLSGMKIQADAALRLIRLSRRAYGPGTPAELWRRFFQGTRIVRLHRRDLVAAAVSWWLASKTGQWNVRIGQPVVQPDIETDVTMIHRLHAAQHRANRFWTQLLGALGEPVHEVAYETLVEQWDEGLRGVIQFLDGQPWTRAVPVPNSVRQAGPATAAHIANWVRATAGCEACGQVRGQ